VKPHRVNLHYSDLVNLKKPNENTPLLSVVTSNKKDRPEQIKRLKIISELKKILQNDMIVYGRGFNTINDKFDAIYGSKFHLVLENNYEDFFWTEKLADAYLGWSFPIYVGTKSIARDFPLDSYYRPDPDLVPEHVAKHIINRINEGVSKNNLSSMIKARKEILNNHNMFAQIYNIINNMTASTRLSIKGKINPNVDWRPQSLLKGNKRIIKNSIRRIISK